MDQEMESHDIAKDADPYRNLKPLYWVYDLAEEDPVTRSRQHFFSDMQSLILDFCHRNFQVIKASIDKGENQYTQSDLDGFNYVPVSDNQVVDVMKMKIMDTDKNKMVKDVYKLDTKPVKK